MSSEPDGLIFSVQRMAVHDGPGWRTLVFLKGCPLRCRWCCNPESWISEPELAFDSAKCIGAKKCGFCIGACPHSAILVSKQNGSIAVDRNRCCSCGECVDYCPSNARHIYGNRVTAPELLEIVEKDVMFYSRSGGGVTLGGGEPLLQIDFVTRFLDLCKKNGLHTAVETCGAVPWSNLERAVPSIDHLFFDVKSTDNELHKQYTGVPNQLILNNLQKLCSNYPELKLTVRIPVIPEFNDSPEQIKPIIKFLRSQPAISNIELMPYHRFGIVKYNTLNRAYPMEKVTPPSPALLKVLREMIPSGTRQRKEDF